MGKVYKDKKSKGCALCKPHKHGWAPKKKVNPVRRLCLLTGKSHTGH